MIEIDGSFKEGGGGILRNALTLSLITQKPFKITNIRKNRSSSGLKRQHLKCIELAKLVSGSKSTNTHLGSEEVEFFPSKITNGKDIEIDIGTAGSTTLLLQSVFLPCLLSKKKFKLKAVGGTDVAFSPGADYFKDIYLSTFSDYAKINCEIIRRGYYPKGQGYIELSFKLNKDLKPLNLVERGELMAFRGVCHASSDLESIKFCERVHKGLEVLLSDTNTPLSIKKVYGMSSSTGSGVFLQAYFENLKLGVSLIGNNADNLASDAVSYVKKNMSLGLGVDSHLADQLIPLLGLVKGRIVCDEITDHILSSIYVCELFLEVKYKINKKSGEISVI
ncbi:MAG: RNA 3'-terminal phosphate cyclase [Candidatus Woesearchaeota archaeon]